jgi:hypothetical protein
MSYLEAKVAVDVSVGSLPGKSDYNLILADSVLVSSLE